MRYGVRVGEGWRVRASVVRLLSPIRERSHDMAACRSGSLLRYTVERRFGYVCCHAVLVWSTEAVKKMEIQIISLSTLIFFPDSKSFSRHFLSAVTYDVLSSKVAMGHILTT